MFLVCVLKCFSDASLQMLDISPNLVLSLGMAKSEVLADRRPLCDEFSNNSVID